MVSGRWVVHHADCLDIMKTMDAKSVDHVITDPPYSEHVHGKSRAGARRTPLADGNGRMSRCAIDRAVNFGFTHLTDATRRFASAQCSRVMRRWMLTFSDVESSHLWAESLSENGLDYCRTGAWIKIGATPQFTGDRPGVGFEAIVIAHRRGKKKWNGGGSLAVWSHLTAIDRGSPSGTACRVHPTQKPLSLMIQLVSLFTDHGDLVLDPFCGSGSTGVACIRLGRRFIGIEKDATYVSVARERLEAEVINSDLTARRSGQEALFR